MKNHHTRRSTDLPFFWAPFAVAFAIGCSAGGGEGLSGTGTRDAAEPGAPSALTSSGNSAAAQTDAAGAGAATSPTNGAANDTLTGELGSGASETAEDDSDSDGDEIDSDQASDADDDLDDSDADDDLDDSDADDDLDDSDADDDLDDSDADDDLDDSDADDDLDDSDADDDGSGTPPSVPPDTGAPPPPAVNAVTFTETIRPILVTNCSRCHASGGLPNFASADASLGYDIAVRERNEIVELIEQGEMPADTCRGGAPGSSGCVAVADLQAIRAWIAAGTPE